MLLTTSSVLLFVSLLVYGPAAATFWSVFNSNHRLPSSYSPSSSGYGYGYGSNGLSSSYSRFKRHVPRLEKLTQLKSGQIRPVNNVYTTVAPTPAQYPSYPSYPSYASNSALNPVEMFGKLNSKLLNHASQYNKLVEDEIKRQQITWLSIPGLESMMNKTSSLGGSIYPKLFIPADMSLQAMMAMRKKLESLGPSAISSLPSLPKLRIGIAMPPRPEPTPMPAYYSPKPVVKEPVVSTYQKPCPEVVVTPKPIIVNNYDKPHPQVVVTPAPGTVNNYDKPCSGAAVIGKQQQKTSSSSKVTGESSKADLSGEKDDKTEAKISANDESKLTASSVSESSPVSGNLEVSAKTDVMPSPSTSNLNEDSSVSAKDAIGMPLQNPAEAKSASASASASISEPSSSITSFSGASARKNTLSGSSSEIQPFFNLIQPNEPLAATKVEIDPSVDEKSANEDQDDALNGQSGFVNSDSNDGLNSNPSSIEDESVRGDASNQESMFSSNV